MRQQELWAGQKPEESERSLYHRWPLDQGAIVLVVHRRTDIGMPGQPSLWQFKYLKIAGKTERGELDKILLFEQGDDDEPAVDTRKLLAESIRFE